MYNANQNMNLNSNVRQPNNIQSNINQVAKPICYDFVCPHCGVKIPENQLYQFIQRPQPIQPDTTNSQLNNINTNELNHNFNNMEGIVNNQTSSNIHNNFSSNNGVL